MEIEQGRDAWYPAILPPFDQAVDVDGEHSVGLRFQGRVVGWLITQRLASNQLLYKTMFVKKEFQHLGVGVTMAVEMIRQTQIVCRVPYGMMFVERGNEAMLYGWRGDGFSRSSNGRKCCGGRLKRWAVSRE